MEKQPKATVFKFLDYKFEPGQKRIVFNYKQEFKDREALKFSETLLLPEIPNLSGIPAGLISKILEGTHLILGISYYKSHCAPIVRHNYKINKKEADFWNIVYKKGLGEFFYRNSLNPKISPKFSFSKTAKTKTFELERNQKCLVAVSGGKDSIVAAELLKQAGVSAAAIFTETERESPIVNNVIKELGLPGLKFRRILDPKILDRHKYDGHVPVSAMFAFLGILYAVLYKHSYCVMANEFSSNFGNAVYKGIEINHQWSKSSEFENLFSGYVREFITQDIKYFSLLRPFYEIRISEMFSRYKKYFPLFSSCNKNFTVKQSEKEGLWCGQCPKCVFAFTLLSAFLPKNDLVGIFNKNLYDDPNLLPIFRDIMGMGSIKPFDCVGTFEESRAAFKMGSKNFENSLIVRQLSSKIKISKAQIDELFKSQKSPNIPAQFKFLGMKSALILGYGKEGKTTEEYLKINFPNLAIGKADEKISKNYLEKQKKFDIAIKTPGIPKEKIFSQYTTATNIFFAETKRLGIKTVGVTGSKGKSTTASLIFEMLKSGGKKAKLLGNIGNPMLEALKSEISPEEIFVVELSSYQLDDIAFSPDIAVITSLFPEHMDYHGSVEKYFEAKKNITKFQQDKDIFIFNPKDKKAAGWADRSKGKPVKFLKESFLAGANILLPGEHNKQNILGAAAAARQLGISDSAIKNAINNFQGLAHRLEFLGEFKGIKFYNDAISTTPESTIAAIKALKNIDTIFLGGQDRGYNFSQLEKEIKKHKIKNVVLFPESGAKIELPAGINILKTRDMEQAVKFGYKNTAQGKICLLSCASPSYSLWENFEEKGNQFKEAVKKYAKTF